MKLPRSARGCKLISNPSFFLLEDGSEVTREFLAAVNANIDISFELAGELHRYERCNFVDTRGSGAQNKLRLNLVSSSRRTSPTEARNPLTAPLPRNSRVRLIFTGCGMTANTVAALLAKKSLVTRDGEKLHDDIRSHQEGREP